MYKKILIATRSPYCSSLIQFLIEKEHEVTVAIPATHSALQPILAPLLPPDQIHITAEESISDFDDQDLILFMEFPPMTMNNVHTIEIHFGQIPDIYGPEALFWALKEGKRLANISLIEHHHGSDQMTLRIEKSFDIMPGENIGMLSARLAILMVSQIEELLKGIGGGKTINLTELKHHTAPSEDDLTIQWNEMEAIQIEHLADASNPKYGGARTKITGSPIQILEVTQAKVNAPEGQPPSPPGTIIHASTEQGLFVACRSNTFIRLNILSTPEGFYTGQKLSSLGTQPGILLG